MCKVLSTSNVRSANFGWKELRDVVLCHANADNNFVILVEEQLVLTVVVLMELQNLCKSFLVLDLVPAQHVQNQLDLTITASLRM